MNEDDTVSKSTENEVPVFTMDEFRATRADAIKKAEYTQDRRTILNLLVNALKRDAGCVTITNVCYEIKAGHGIGENDKEFFIALLHNWGYKEFHVELAHTGYKSHPLLIFDFKLR